MLIVDTHTHIEGEKFAEDRQEVIKRAAEAGVKIIVNAAFDYDSSVKAAELAKNNAGVYACMGFHPCDSAGYNQEMEEKLISLYESSGGKNGKIKAIGEIGLDYHYDDTDKAKQYEVLEAQVNLAKKLNLPIVIHARDADQDTYDLLEKFGAFEGKVLMHCFGGSVEMARKYVNKGALLGIGGVLTFKNARKLLEVASEISLENIVLETDAPYLTPVPYRGKRNEPAYTAYTAQKLAEIKGISVEEVAIITSENALKFYNIRI